MVNFKDRKWIVYGASGYPAFITPFGVVPSREFLKLYGFTNEVVVLWKGRTFDWLFDEVQMVSLSKAILPLLLEKQWKYYFEWQEKAKEFDDAHYKLFSLEVTDLNDLDLKEWMQQYYQLFVCQYRANNLIEPLSFYFQHHLKDLLIETGVSTGDTKELSDAFGIPAKENYIKQCVREYKDAGQESISQILRKYHYIKSDYTGSVPLSEEDIKELVAKEMHEVARGPVTVNLPEEAKKLLTVLQVVATIQDVRKAESLMWVTGAERLLSEFARRNEVPMEEILFATWEEILEERFVREELQERANGSVYMWGLDGVSVYTGEIARDTSNQLRQALLEGEKTEGEFKGVSASRGKFTGRVRVIIDKVDFDKVEKADVLVTVMTRPEYLPVMHLAGAFVTDEGGITSHAAIVAREMKKPCVIATQIASKILKDGDLVEVDADNGVVRVIEKAQEKKEIILSKYMSREHSMFYAHVWNESNRDYFDEYIPDTNIKNMLFVRNERGVLDVYYDLDELKTIFDRIVKGVVDNPSILDTVIGDFYAHWKELLPYLNGEKHISSSEDLKSYYMHYMRWWGPMAYIFVIPDREGIPENLRVKALKVREETQEYSDEGDRVYLEYITRAFPNLESIAHLMTPEEAYRGETLSSEEIVEIGCRSSGCGLLTIQGNTHFSPTTVTGEVLKEFGIQLTSLDVGDAREIEGASASTGNVQGRVKMVLVKADLARVSEGDIMVTYATSPDYVPAMKKCSGIVTDEGGVVCHTAIVSRELGIPCVVGTKIATQVLKDGDLVEVDADNGVVRVVERKQEKIELQKSYVRDTTLFMQGLWARGLTDEMTDKFRWANPHLPFVAHFVNDGVVEIWEHKKAISWLLDMILSENKKGMKFLDDLFVDYKNLLRELEKLHAKEYLSISEDIQKYTDLIYKASLYMTTFFYVGADERNPKEAHDIAIQARKEGDFFAVNDVFVRRNIARIGNISEELAGVVLPEELDTMPSKEILEQRLKSYLLIDGKEKFVGSLDDFSKENPEYVFLREKSEDGITELNGKIAHRGVVRGHVRIVLKQSHMLKVIMGDILVAPMTTPDFLPAMKLAAAFVTDEGGITCHAAIVARELKKPCIIGTKIATQVLKDGDLVEVDADNGVVRVLEKGNSNSVQSRPITTLTSGLEGNRDELFMDGRGPFHCIVRYPKLPIINIEAMFRCYINNELFQYCDTPPHPVVVTFMDSSYEAWSDIGAIPIVSDDDSIESIIKHVQNAILCQRDALHKIESMDTKQMQSPEILIDVIRRANEVSTDIYRGFTFFIDESFHTEDTSLIVRLQEVRLELDTLFSNLMRVYDKVADILIKHFNFDKEIIWSATTDELVGMIRSNDDGLYANISSRPIAFIMDGNEIKTVFGEEALLLKNVMHKQDPMKDELVKAEQKGILKGMVGNQGCAKGRVRIIHATDYYDKKKLSQLEGERDYILIIPMTSPDSFQYFKNALAFVTDEGGVTCHAAIIAREMKKPCIIGTKIATQVLKDGDLVEVDADNGVVRVLEKAK